MGTRILPLTPDRYDSVARFIESRAGRPPLPDPVRRRTQWLHWLAEAAVLAEATDVPLGWILEHAGDVEGVHITTPFNFQFEGEASKLLVSSNLFVAPGQVGMPAYSLFRTFLRFRDRMHLAATTANELSGRLWEASRGLPIEGSRMERHLIGHRAVGLIEEVLVRRAGGSAAFRRVLGEVAPRRQVMARFRERVVSSAALEELEAWPVSRPTTSGHTGLYVTPELVDWVCRNPSSPALIVRVHHKEALLVCVVRAEGRGHRGQIREARFIAASVERGGPGSGPARALVHAARLLGAAADLSVAGLRGDVFSEEHLAAAGFRLRRRPDVPRWWLPPKGETRTPARWSWTGIEEL